MSFTEFELSPLSFSISSRLHFYDGNFAFSYLTAFHYRVHSPNRKKLQLHIIMMHGNEIFKYLNITSHYDQLRKSFNKLSSLIMTLLLLADCRLFY